MSDAMVILQTKLSPQEVRAVLLALGHPALLKQFDADQQILFTVARLNDGWQPYELARHLCQRFRVSLPTSRRRIKAALNHPSRYRDARPWNDEPIVIEGSLPSRVV